ncbi:MAG: hypothetical protein O3C10_10830 [Chloroflexi bacterium]|nr:hypothetical protein [Chloroflexota bacterium]
MNLALLVLVLLVVYLVFYAGGDDESPNLPDASGTPGDQGRETPLREEFDVIPPTPGHPADTGSQVGIPRPEAEALA